MARFCFYCGRDLTNGEKCNCRTMIVPAGSCAGRKAAGAQRDRLPAARKRTARRPPRSAGAKHAAVRFPMAIRQLFQQSSEIPAVSADGKPGARPAPLDSRTRPTRRLSTSAGPVFGLMLYRLGQYVSGLPKASARRPRKLTRQPVLLVLILQGAAGGLFLLAAARQTIMQALLSLNMSLVQTSTSFINSLFIFIQGFGISLAASLLVALLYHLAMRFLFHQPASFQRLLAALSPCLPVRGHFPLRGVPDAGAHPFLTRPCSSSSDSP